MIYRKLKKSVCYLVGKYLKLIIKTLNITFFYISKLMPTFNNMLSLTYVRAGCKKEG